MLILFISFIIIFISKQRDFIVSSKGLDLLLIKKKKFFSDGSSIIFKRAFKLLLLNNSTSSKMIKRGLSEIVV